MDEPPATEESRPKVKVYLESRYRKLERGLPQTVFFCPVCKGRRRRARKCERCGGFGKLTRDSVQELIARHVLRPFGSRQGKFHGAGREDIDVLMLGRGRPFVFEVVGAKEITVDLAAIDASIRDACAGRIELEPLKVVDKPRVAYWKNSHFDKDYRVRVETNADVDGELVAALAGRSFDIVQRTPSRVAHRRADLERHRRVEVLAVSEVDTRAFGVDIRCQHGTYVKEWVSGDEGRTVPSLSSEFGVAAACAQLDVLEILTEDA